MFSVGDKVMHCSHGAGVITEQKEMQIADAPQRYLVIQLLGSSSTLMVPTEHAEVRLRPACRRAALQRLVASELTSEPEELDKDYKQRQKYLEEKLKSGETQVWLGVVRDLSRRAEQVSLSSGDRQLLDRAIDLLSGELALAQGIPLREAGSHLKMAIEHRHELADQMSENSIWWRTLGQRITQPFAGNTVSAG